MKVINNILNKIYEYKLISIILIVSLTSIMHGLNIWQYTIYNFDSLFYKEYSQNYILDSIIQMNNNGAFVLNIFNSFFKPLLQIPILYLISSIVIKSTITYIIYLIIDKLIIDKKISFIIALMFILSVGYAAHGVVLNGIWGGPIFFRGSVSALMSLIGLYLVVTKRYNLAIIPFILSIHLHVLYGVTTFAFIFTSFIYYFLIYSRKDLKPFLILSIVSAISILPIILSIDSSTFNTIDSDINLWYQYVFATDPDDMSMIWFLSMKGYFTIPFLFLTLYFYVINKNKQTIDYLFMGSFIFFCIVMFIEVLHYNSIFFGALSEKFIGVQFRRGVWILFLFSAIINFKNVQKLIDTGNNKLIYLLIGCGFIYLFPNIIALYIVLFLLLVYFRKTKIAYLIVLSLLFLYIGISLDFYYPNKLYKSFTFILIATFFIATLVYYKVISKNNILLSVLIFFVLSTSLVGLVKGNYKNDLHIITTDGLFDYPNLLKLEKKIYNKQGKIINYKIINYIRNNNNKKDFVLESMNNLYYGDAIIYNCPVFLSRGEIAMPMFSKLFYENLLYKLNIFNVSEKALFNSKAMTLNKIDKQIGLLSKIEVVKLNKEQKIRFLITKTNFSFMQPLISENSYSLYDLEALK